MHFTRARRVLDACSTRRKQPPWRDLSDWPEILASLAGFLIPTSQAADLRVMTAVKTCFHASARVLFFAFTRADACRTRQARVRHASGTRQKRVKIDPIRHPNSIKFDPNQSPEREIVTLLLSSI
jgi:hypothetical protein